MIDDKQSNDQNINYNTNLNMNITIMENRLRSKGIKIIYRFKICKGGGGGKDG